MEEGFTGLKCTNHTLHFHFDVILPQPAYRIYGNGQFRCHLLCCNRTITVGILTAPKELHGYGWGILPATLIAIALGALFGWGLAYPTARLRTDYFAIVTISLGEIVRVLLAGEPLLRGWSSRFCHWNLILPIAS